MACWKRKSFAVWRPNPLNAPSEFVQISLMMGRIGSGGNFGLGGVIRMGFAVLRGLVIVSINRRAARDYLLSWFLRGKIGCDWTHSQCALLLVGLLYFFSLYSPLVAFFKNGPPPSLNGWHCERMFQHPIGPTFEGTKQLHPILIKLESVVREFRKPDIYFWIRAEIFDGPRRILGSNVQPYKPREVAHNINPVGGDESRKDLNSSWVCARRTGNDQPIWNYKSPYLLCFQRVVVGTRNMRWHNFIKVLWTHTKNVGLKPKADADGMLQSSKL